MYVNGVYINDIPYILNRNNDYKNVDILISSQDSDITALHIKEDYQSKGSNGNIIWGKEWPRDLLVLGADERVSYYKQLNISYVSKELLFFRNINFLTYQGLVIMTKLNTYMSSLNIQYVLHYLNSNMPENLQVLFLLEMHTYNDYKLSSNIDSKLGVLII